MDRILYIEAIDINSLYGSGGGPMFRYSNKVSRQFTYITITSSSEKLGKIHIKKIDGLNTRYMPICRTISNTYVKRIVPLNLYFILNIIFRFKHINKLKIKNIFTKTYTVLWLFTLIKKKYNICYIFPGLENPILIGRFSKIGNMFLPIYKIINFEALKRTSAMFVAASEKTINEKTIELKLNSVNTQLKKIPQAVDTAMFRNRNKEICKQKIKISEKYIFTFLGRLASVKGIDFIIDTFRQFNLKYPDSKLLIIGDGEDRDKISNIIKRNNLSDMAIMVGKKTPPELIDYICASEAGIFASHKEGFSNAMLEFIACGIPVISTNVGGVDELIIENQTGYIIHNRNQGEFLNAMEAVINKDFKSLCTKHVRDNYTLSAQWKIIADRWPTLKIEQEKYYV